MNYNILLWTKINNVEMWGAPLKNRVIKGMMVHITPIYLSLCFSFQIIKGCLYKENTDWFVYLVPWEQSAQAFVDYSSVKRQCIQKYSQVQRAGVKSPKARGCLIRTCGKPSLIFSPFSSAISMTSRTCSMNDSRSLSKMNSLST